MSEYLHATDPRGRLIKTGERQALLDEIRDYARQHGEAPFAVPVVHVILVDSEARVRLVQRGNKRENPFLWDKAMGGHVADAPAELPRSAFDDNVHKEMAEEIGINHVVIAADAFAFNHLLRTQGVNTHHTALLKLIDHDPWQAGVSRVNDGPPWVKRQNVAVYMGIYDGPFTFVDGEAIAERRVDKGELLLDCRERPWAYADGVRVILERYYAFLRIL